MSKETIIYSCGHSTIRQLGGPIADRQRYIKWAAERGTCAACAKQDKLLACADVEAEYSMPALTGSEKQIAWARSIRAEKLAEALKFAETFEKTATAEQKEQRIGQLLGKTEAKFWIDNRFQGGGVLMREIAAGKR